MKLSRRYFEDNLSEGLTLAGYDVADERGKLYMALRLWYGEPKKVMEAATRDLSCKAAGWKMNRSWVKGDTMYIELKME